MESQRELTNLDILWIAKDMERELVQNQARLDQFYDLGERIIIKFKTKIGKKDVVFFPPEYLFLRESEKTEAENTPFASSVKNLLLNRLLKSVKQLNNDRIIELEFDSASLILECTKKGNVILISEGKIKNLKSRIAERDRALEIGAVYAPPKNEKKGVKFETILEALNDKEMQNEKIVVAITKRVSFPAFYVNKIFESEGLDPKKKVSELKDDKRKEIAKRIDGFYKDVTESNAKPISYQNEVFLADEQMLRRLSGWKETSMSNELLQSYTKKENLAKEKEKGKRMEKLLDRLKHQEERMKNLESQIEEEKRKGEWIIQHGHEVTKIIEQYKEIRKKGNKQEMEEFLKKNNLELTKDGIKIKTAKQ
ncbi:MAG: NFACT family protein [Candidatus Micrarchaeota archaeon]|nr:NFACT family protein [Candidatus Micrarchaeota archaeon]